MQLNINSSSGSVSMAGKAIGTLVAKRGDKLPLVLRVTDEYGTPTNDGSLLIKAALRVQNGYTVMAYGECAKFSDIDGAPRFEGILNLNTEALGLALGDQDVILCELELCRELSGNKIVSSPFIRMEIIKDLIDDAEAYDPATLPDLATKSYVNTALADMTAGVVPEFVFGTITMIDSNQNPGGSVVYDEINNRYQVNFSIPRAVSGATYELPVADTETLGGVMEGSGVAISASGVISVSTGSETTPGLVQVGSNINVANGVISVSTGSTTVPGVLQVGDNLSVSSGIVSVGVGTTTSKGVLSVGSNINVASGVISVPTGSKTSLGALRVGTNIDVASGVISVPIATASVPGVFKVGDGLTMTNGVLSVSGSGSGSVSLDGNNAFTGNNTYGGNTVFNGYINVNGTGMSVSGKITTLNLDISSTLKHTGPTTATDIMGSSWSMRMGVAMSYNTYKILALNSKPTATDQSTSNVEKSGFIIGNYDLPALIIEGKKTTMRGKYLGIGYVMMLNTPSAEPYEQIDIAGDQINIKPTTELDLIGAAKIKIDDVPIKQVMANMAMPSGSVIDLVLPASGGTVIAPADGYIGFAKNTVNIEFVALFNDSNLGIRALANGGNAVCFLPVKKNQQISVVYSASGALTYFNFMYANGSV